MMKKGMKIRIMAPVLTLIIAFAGTLFCRISYGMENCNMDCCKKGQIHEASQHEDCCCSFQASESSHFLVPVSPADERNDGAMTLHKNIAGDFNHPLVALVITARSPPRTFSPLYILKTSFLL